MKLEIALTSGLEMENGEVTESAVPTIAGEPVFRTKTSPVTCAVLRLLDDEGKCLSTQAIQLKFSGKLVLVDRSSRIAPDLKALKK